MTKAVKTIEPTEMQPVSQEVSMMQVIERIASDPNADIDKLERMLAMKERLDAKQAEMAFTSDFSAMQSELPEITEGGKIKHGDKVISEYARWDEDINPVIKPILANHGFALSFRINTKDGINVEAVLSHRSGHTERTSIHLPADTSGSKNAVQAVASSVSYGKRYTAGALLNLTTCGADDDGNMGGVEKISAEQANEIHAMITENEINMARFLGWLKSDLKCNSIEDINLNGYGVVMARLNQAIKAKK